MCPSESLRLQAEISLQLPKFIISAIMATFDNEVTNLAHSKFVGLDQENSRYVDDQERIKMTAMFEKLLHDTRNIESIPYNDWTKRVWGEKLLSLTSIPSAGLQEVLTSIEGFMNKEKTTTVDFEVLSNWIVSPSHKWKFRQSVCPHNLHGN